MRFTLWALLALLFTFSSVISAESIGDRLLRTFLVFKEEPLTADKALTLGWKNLSRSCVEGRGYQFAKSTSGPTKGSSTWLLYNNAGQLSGFGVRAFGKLPHSLSPRFWIPVKGSANMYDIFITFREDMCGDESEPVLGDRLLINGEFPIPVQESEAKATGWFRGNCIKRMGTHWSYDLSSPGHMTWNASSMVPVMPMYLGNGKIHAILFASPDAQRIEPFGEWEGPFTRGLFCYNWCKEDSKACGNFSNISFWTSLHFLFSDPDLATCEDAICKL